MTEKNNKKPAEAPSPGASRTMSTIENKYYSQQIHGPYEKHSIGNLKLKEGKTLRNTKIAYTTFGELNNKKDNAILFPHMYSGTSKDMEMYIGENQPLDPTKYFIILPNQIGNGLSTSPHNTKPPNGQADFPQINISDDVRAQHKLITEKFGIEKLELVLGWSMGAQQTYEWIVRYPEMVKKAAPIGGTAKNPVISKIFVDTLIDAIQSDPNYRHGYYKKPHAVQQGLKRHAKLFSMMGASSKLYSQKDWKKPGFTSLNDFLTNFWNEWFLPMDPNNLICMAKKWREADVSQNTNGDLKKALKRIKAKVYVMPFEEDMFFTLDQCEKEEKHIPNSELHPIPTTWGHFGMLGMDPNDKKYINNKIQKLLKTN
ncbi:Homoserine acetyltransferase MET2 [Methanonatronarchaeum thermophilum]|uniref:Homoserine acetyltransferase MET2 n=1 Tax=Methanonatronarchaeum thermophilum TaxID=1927129 RepID=A0A1Y3GBD8_9EURY|nr:alpha/beta fold hydrolase [Methanonatronarchaeum thermophilum]OUJ18550.1 Homoserine acetyltransferase MET2 [Methanonatronarchaeum thermophilum]